MISLTISVQPLETYPTHYPPNHHHHNPDEHSQPHLRALDYDKILKIDDHHDRNGNFFGH